MQLKGAEPGTLTIASAADTDARVAGRPAGAGGSWAALRRGSTPCCSRSSLDRTARRRRRREWEAESAGAIRAADIADSPFLLAATSVEEAAAELLRRRDRWGITSWCTHAPSGPALADVAAVVRALGG